MAKIDNTSTSSSELESKEIQHRFMKTAFKFLAYEWAITTRSRDTFISRVKALPVNLSAKL